MRLKVGALAILALGWYLPGWAVFADDDCDYDDCITVTAKRITCEDGWTCSDGMPFFGRQACWRDLTGMPHAPISAPYGEPRKDGIHSGVDIAVPTGTPVHAAKDGVVSQVVRGFLEGDRSTHNGNYIRINYDDGTQGAYLHLLAPSVEEGWSVDAGDTIGTSNDTGSGTNAHLHYTQYTDGSRTETVDPTLEHSACG